MVKLTEFDRYKLEGFIYLTHELYEESLESFEKALYIKADPTFLTRWLIAIVT